MDAETRFFSGLIELQYGRKVENKLRKLASGVPWAKGWPKNKKAFWNAEAFMWRRKIDPKKREFIAEELSFLQGKKNLDLGCGGYSYFPSAVGVDLSEKMLQLNENCRKKMVGDLEKKLPFKKKEFDSVTVIFVLNYVENYPQLLSEIKRVLTDKGTVVIVLGAKGVNDWEKQQEVNNFSVEEWKDILGKSGFLVEFYEKGKVWFFVGKKGKKLLNRKNIFSE